MNDKQTSIIAALNDEHRTLLKHGQLVMTRGVMDMGLMFMVGAMLKVTSFTDFTEANNPHGERDFGQIEHDGETLFWKIDYFADAECLYGAEEPWNPDCSYRVLTLMLTSEY